MRLRIWIAVSLALASLPALPAAGAPGEPASPAKLAAVATVERHRAELVGLADRVWGYAETALTETRSAAALADWAESQGFRVERGVAGLPTAFVASYGEGEPVIAIMGEYDALPGLSQKAQAAREPVTEGAAGHGCGHNLFGAASLGAAAAVKERIAAGELSGTVRFYGTPAEEAVGGKLYMLRAGLFDDVDVALAWHPDQVTAADTSGSQAMVELFAEFRGTAAHAAYDPWNGRSALDAAELFTHAVNLQREHVRPTVRMHYTIRTGDAVPNVVPEHATVWLWVRDSTHQSVDLLIERAREMAAGAALAAGVEGELRVGTGDYEMVPNLAGARLLQETLDWLGPIPFSEESERLAREIQEAAGVEPTRLNASPEPFDEEPGEPEGGSTDVADVSWVVPTLHLVVTTAPGEVPWHAWPVVAASGSSIGHEGMTYAAKALAATMVDLFQRPDARRAIAAEHAERTAGKPWQGYLPPGPPPETAEP